MTASPASLRTGHHPSQLHETVLQVADDDAARPALTQKDQTLDYQSLAIRIQRFARALQDAGIRRGERVAVHLDKRFETVVAIYGTSAAGGVAVPINPVLKPAQIAHVVADCAPAVFVGGTAGLQALVEHSATASSVRVAVSMAAGEDEVIAGRDLTARVLPWDEFVDVEAAPSSFHAVDSDPAAIFYTSGSTGRPKGVVVSHRNLIVGGQSVSSYLGNEADDRILAALPLSFDAGFSQLTTAFTVGAQVVLLNYLFPKDVVGACERHHITGLTCVPPLWIQLAGVEWSAKASESLRYFATTGGRMPKAVLTQLRSVFPQARPYLMYGLTEAFRSTYLDPVEIDRRPDSIGKSIPNADVVVVHESGRLCEPGEEGELVHRGPLVALGYWNDAERTAERFKPAPQQVAPGCRPDIAVWSGDRVVADEDGFLFFVGRNDEMIKTSGYRVSPSEIEEAAHGSQLIRDAVALGVVDERIGQRIVLFVSPVEGSDEVDVDALLGSMRKELPRFMVPASVVVQPALPRSANGKFDRQALRAIAEESA